MSQNVPPRMEGQIEAPNPLELFWEKNKRIVIFGAVAAVVAIAINYFIQYQTRRAVAERWSALAQAAGLDAGYAETDERWTQIQTTISSYDAVVQQNPNMAAQVAQLKQQMIGQFVQELQFGLLTELEDGIESADPMALQKIADAKDDRSPLAVWVLANRAYFDGDFDAAEGYLEALEANYPQHFLCRSSEFPVQWRPEVPKDDEAEKDPTPPRRNEKPDLEPPVPGSEVDLFRARIERQRTFRAEHPEFYVPKEPTSPQTVVFEIENAGTVKIKLFSDLVPAHAAAFLKLAEQGWWTGERIHEIKREGEGPTFGASPNELVFGWTSTRDTDDRAEWKAGEIEKDHLVPWEDAPLSHFPGTVAALPANQGEGKSQVERIAITGADTAERDDGTRVIIGRVVEGLEVVEEIINGGFADAASATTGVGMPELTYTITAVRIE